MINQTLFIPSEPTTPIPWPNTMSSTTRSSPPISPSNSTGRGSQLWPGRLLIDLIIGDSSLSWNDSGPPMRIKVCECNAPLFDLGVHFHVIPWSEILTLISIGVSLFLLMVCKILNVSRSALIQRIFESKLKADHASVIDLSLEGRIPIRE